MAAIGGRERRRGQDPEGLIGVLVRLRDLRRRLQPEERRSHGRSDPVTDSRHWPGLAHQIDHLESHLMRAFVSRSRPSRETELGAEMLALRQRVSASSMFKYGAARGSFSSKDCHL